MTQPLILTLQMDEPAWMFYEDLRRRYFPAERNFIPAHLTLFHHLPDEEHIYQVLQETSEGTSEFKLHHPNVRSMGRGVAVFFRSEPLLALHAGLSAAFETELIAQDRQRLRPHTVVQNKVGTEAARETLAQVQAASLAEKLPEPKAVGMMLWRYLGGPWERVSEFRFGGGAPE